METAEREKASCRSLPVLGTTAVLLDCCCCGVKLATSALQIASSRQSATSFFAKRAQGSASAVPAPTLSQLPGGMDGRKGLLLGLTPEKHQPQREGMFAPY